MLELLSHHASAAVVCFDERGVILWANPRFASALALDPAEVVGRDYWAFTAPGQKNRELNEIMASRGGFEKELVRADGSTLTARVLFTSVVEEAEATRFLVALSPVDEGGEGRASVERKLRLQNAILLDLAKVDAVDAGQLEAAFAAITEASAKGVGCERSSIWLYNDDASSIVCHDLYRISEQDHGLKGFTLESKDYPGYFAALAEDRTIAADDAHKHPATREFSAGYLTPLGINSMLEAPIRRGGKLIGVLCHEHVGPSRQFTQEETNFAASVAELVTRALEAAARKAADEKLREAHAALERHAEELEHKVAERTRSIQLILDNTGEGLLVCDLSGQLTGESSRVVGEWFGQAPGGAQAAAFLWPDDGRAQAAFQLGFAQLVEDVLPFALSAEQMPSELVRGNRCYRIRYRQVFDAQRFARVLMVVRDATAEAAAERSEREARELHALLGHLLRDRPGFWAIVHELDQLCDELASQPDLLLRRRTLHTLKGNAAIFGLAGLSRLAHDVEDASTEQGVLSDAMVAPVVSAWHEAKARIQRAFGGESRGVELSEREYEEFLAELRQRAVDEVVIARVRAWQAAPAARVFERLAAQAERVAQQLGKDLDVELGGADVRVPLRELSSFWSSLVHVVRNAIDHGIELPETREQVGKRRAGTLKLAALHEGEALVVEISDDGRGIDWARVRDKALAAGLPANDQHDLVEAVFADGVSTAQEATELSGRGVGLAAVRAACEALGGAAELHSTPGHGTRFRFRVPVRRSAA